MFKGNIFQSVSGHQPQRILKTLGRLKRRGQSITFRYFIVYCLVELKVNSVHGKNIQEVGIDAPLGPCDPLPPVTVGDDH